ncbi:MAG: outer membrane protein assembly factor [Pseudomonadota bacterium]
MSSRFFKPLLLLSIGLLLAVFGTATGLELKIDGGNDAQREAVLGTTPARRIRDAETDESLDFWLRRLSTEGAKALQPLGYYNAQISGAPEGAAVRVQVEPGEPVRVTSVAIRFQDADVSPTVTFPLAAGAVFDHQSYETGKQAIAAWLLAQGYLASELITHEVRVHRQRRAAEIELTWRPGPRYRFGEVRFTDSPLAEGFLRRYLTISPGEYFSERRLQSISEALRGSGYFAAVEIVPGALDPLTETVPLEIQLTPRKQSAYQAGVIYATDAGPGLEAGVERRWLNDRGYQGRVRLELATRRSLAAARLDIPSARDLDRSLSLSLNYVDESTDSSDRQTGQLAVSRQSRWGAWNRVDALTYLRENFEIGQQEDTVSFLLGSLELARQVSDGSPVPRAGWRASLETQLGADALASDTNLARVELNAKSIYGVGEQYRLLLRGNLGALWSDDFNQVPASLRFFAGGDQSVRGFDFEELGPTDELGEPTGGEYLAVASVEFDGPLRGNFRWAAFVDAGNAFGGGDDDIAYAAGLGLRWLTPIGPLRLDIASALSDSDSNFRIHFTAGPDL